MPKKTKKKVSKKSSNLALESTKIGVTPLGDRVLIKPFTEMEAKNQKSASGIILPDSVSKEKSAQGKVIAVGPGRFIDGEQVPVSVKVGDIVVFSKYSYDELEYGGEELYLLKEDNLLAVIKNSF